ncbi:MAG: 2-oxopent-4-enoate hydratase [Gammaproteobacteria bacterium]|nr:2-oxopent-4-enoate hydratase [Gammaproteobacteria bacterium]
MVALNKLDAYAEEIYQALRTRQVIAPLTEREPELTQDEAYQISLGILKRREAAGEKIVGKKIGATSRAVQTMLNVDQPDYGFLTDRMQCKAGEPIPISRELIQPRAEGEIAFVLKRDLQGPGVTNADVLAATAGIAVCYEIVDSRIRDWKIKIQDTVADNASCGMFVVSTELVDPHTVDLVTCGMVLWKNGELIATGAGAAALGSPINCVTWLANVLGRHGVGLKAGETILSGSLVPLIPIVAGDEMELAVGGLGRLTAKFV